MTDGYDNAVMGVIIATMIAMVPFCALVAVLVEVYVDLWDVRDRACSESRVPCVGCEQPDLTRSSTCWVPLAFSSQVYTFNMSDDDKWVLELLPHRSRVLLLFRCVRVAAGGCGNQCTAVDCMWDCEERSTCKGDVISVGWGGNGVGGGSEVRQSTCSERHVCAHPWL